jgi:hypothetical protein
MDLHGIVSPVIASVNPMTSAELHKSNGSITSPSGKPEPSYAPPVIGEVQVQALSGQQLQHVNSMGISGILRKVYLYGDWESVVRRDLTGGDLFVFDSGRVVGGTWLVVTVLEIWPDWCCVAVQLQVVPV